MERAKAPFTDLQDLIERTLASANKGTIEALIKSGALDSFPHTRAEMLAVLPKMMTAASKARKKHLSEQIALEDSFFGGDEMPAPFHFQTIEYPTDITQLTKRQMLEMEMEVCGMYVSGHPMAEYKDVVGRKISRELCQLSSSEDAPAEVQDGEQVRVAGVIRVVKNITTKKKSAMAFITIEDQTGKAEVTVFPQAFEAYGERLKEGTAILVYGKAELNEFGAHVIADSIAFLDDMLASDDERAQN